jgi:hypothetical protein
LCLAPKALAVLSIVRASRIHSIVWIRISSGALPTG